MSNDKNKANRLIDSTSPYLQQHVYNPVDWYPWGAEALDKAKNEDKPIIVSIGYSACHWCHVMEHESFEDDGTASLMNEYFVCIKVDREERPDIDNIYMESIHAMGLQGGWPLNVFLTPDQKPFYGGTYFPKQGWQQLLKSVAEAFKSNREKLNESAEKFTESLLIDEVEKYQLKDYFPGIEDGFLTEVTDKFYQKLDQVYGGVEKAPKFPMPSIWSYLMKYYFATKDEKYLEVVKLTLDKMADGGIYDQLQGGFARYSVDERWFAPHFEKMLYDNGQLLGLYADAYSLTGSEKYLKVIEQTIEWIKEDLLSPEGGLYSAMDADSEGEEGLYYVWKESDLTKLLGDKTDVFKEYYGITESGNWEKGNNILFHRGKTDAFLEKHNLSFHELESILDDCRTILIEERNKRVKPGLDDKIIAGWNALALKGIVKAFQATGNSEYLSLAQKNAEFLAVELISDNGEVTRVYNSKIPGVLEDYALLIDAFISLYQADFDYRWIHISSLITEYTLTNFHDTDNGMFFYTDSSGEDLIARKKEIFDNVIPSSNSQMAHNLRKIGMLLDKKEWTDLARTMVYRMKKFIQNDIEYTSHWASCCLLFMQPTAEVAILGSDSLEMGQKLSQTYYPFKLVVGNQDSENPLPLLQNRDAIDGKSTIFVCFDKACKLPVHTIEEALNQLPGIEPAGT